MGQTGTPKKSDRSLRIAVDARPLSTPHTGIGQYLSSILARLVPDSHHHWLLYTTVANDNSWTSRWDFANTTLRSCKRIPLLPQPLQNSLQAQRLFARWATGDKADVFWSPRHQLPYLLPKTLPSAVTIHDLVWKTHPETMTRFGHLLEKLMTPKSIDTADVVLTTSNAVGADIELHFPTSQSKLRVYPLGSNIDLPLRHPRTVPQPYYVFCGSIEPRKNLSRLLEAHLLNQAAEPPTRHKLVIVTGNSWKSAELEAQLAANPDSIEVFRNLSEEHKTALLQHADFLVQPSLHEGFGLSVADAMKCHLPVLAARSGALPEVAGDAALYVDPLDTADIARGLRTLCNDPDCRQRLSAAAANRAHLFDWHHTAQQTLGALEAVATGTSPPPARRIGR